MREELGPFVLESALAADLRLLLRGPGAQRGQALFRIGPTLRAMCGIAATDSAADAVIAVAEWLRGRITSLDSEQLRECGLIAFGLHQDARSPTLLGRVRSVEEYLGRSEDTARRRVQTVVTQVARTTTEADSIVHQLRQHVDEWIDMRFVLSDGSSVRARCFLIAAVCPADQPPDKVYAIARFDTGPDTVASPNTAGRPRRARTPGPETVAAIPAVRVRDVHPLTAPPPK
jgi:hypothetical protein